MTTPMMTLAQVVQWLPGAQCHGNAAQTVVRVHTDTRTIEPGDLFVALKGDRFDANDFLHEAEQRVPWQLCATRCQSQRLSKLACIEVPIPSWRWVRLAAAWRAQFTLP
jgi:UDP-N-acetylmuramoyl-tripeptide--D-alanyl-D-alanine ligase